MIGKNWGIKHVGPALLVGVLALFFFLPVAAGQTIRDLPPPPPAPTPKPTPKPTPPPEPKAEDLDIVRVSSNLVMVPVSVVSPNGEAVHGLQVPDFRLEEQGRQQEISGIGNPEQVPLDIALLFDVSSSVSQKGFFQFQQAAAARFLKQVMKPGDRAAVFTISDQPRMVQPLASSETSAAKILTIPAATTSIPTAFYDTVSAAANYLMTDSDDRHRRVVLVISDGDDNFSNLVRESSLAEYRATQKSDAPASAARSNLAIRKQRAVGEVQKHVQKADAAFYAINPGGPSVRLNQISMNAQNSMQSIAESTGGTAFIPNGEQDLERVFNEIAAELRGQYLLQYYSNSEAAPGQFRTIKVGVPAHPEYRIRARQGYYPKGENPKAVGRKP
jgi:Ca-activated chloride channel homolog